jgi:hypothetical protein
MSSYRYAALHLAFAVPLAILCLIAAHTITGGSLDSFLRVAAALPGQAVDERTGRYVLCLAIPFVLLPLTVAAWATLRIRRADPPGAGTILGVALVAGFAATILFWASIKVALATAQRLPSIISRFSLRHAWMFALIWSFIYAAVAGLAHLAALAFVRQGVTGPARREGRGPGTPGPA